MRALVIGLLVAGVASFLVWSYIRRFEDEASGGPKVQVLTVLRTLEPGAVLKEGDLGERGIPQAYVESRAIRSIDKQRITNLRISTNLDAQQILNWSDIVATSDDGRMITKVQPPMRAVTIHTENRSNTLVNPGDRVDVIATLPAQGAGDHRAGIVLFQNVLVLGRSATNKDVNDNGADIALSLTLQNSQLLAVAGDKAKLTIALRSAEDVRIQEGLAEINSKSLTEEEKRAILAKQKAGPQAVKGAGQ